MAKYLLVGEISPGISDVVMETTLNDQQKVVKGRKIPQKEAEGLHHTAAGKRLFRDLKKLPMGYVLTEKDIRSLGVGLNSEQKDTLINTLVTMGLLEIHQAN